jgi:hypothetical protein
MIRWLGLSFAVVFLIGWGSRAEAQMVADPYGSDGSGYGASLYRIAPNGGFGLETMQTPVMGAVVLDRFGLAHGTPLVQLSPQVRASRSGAKASRSLASGRRGRAGYQLPTGRLDWAGASGVVLYSPALRYQNYGGGYGRGPYGSIDCGMMYHGMSLSY